MSVPRTVGRVQGEEDVRFALEPCLVAKEQFATRRVWHDVPDTGGLQERKENMQSGHYTAPHGRGALGRLENAALVRLVEMTSAFVPPASRFCCNILLSPPRPSRLPAF